MDNKTNVMRRLDSLKIPYKLHTYGDTVALGGVAAAQAIGIDPARVFKTLVTVGKTGSHYVFLVPVAAELNLKKAATAVREKSVEMIREKELLPLTGYLHGGCSPIGMKKQFRTTIDRAAEQCGTIVFSAGKIGYQVELTLAQLKKAVPFETADLL